MSRGLQRERDLVLRLRKAGFWAIRSPASKGTADVVAVRRHPEDDSVQVYLIEVKSTAAGPWSHFGPRDRQELREDAEFCGATAWLVHWPARKQPRWYGVEEWPT